MSGARANLCLGSGAQTELPVPGRKGKEAGMGDGFCFGHEVKQDTAALPRASASTAPG